MINFSIYLLSVILAVLGTGMTISLLQESGWKLRWFHTVTIAILLSTIFFFARLGILSII